MLREVHVGAHVLRWAHGGSGTKVLAVHSSGMSSRQWRKLEGALGPGRALVAPDLLGVGVSSPWPPGERFHFLLDQLAIERLIDSLDEPVHLVGHSYGGFLALLAALHRPRAVRSVAVFEPVSFGVLRSTGDAETLATLPENTDLPWPDAPEALEAWLEGFVDYWNGPGGWRAQAEPLRVAFRAAGLKMVGEVRSLGVDRTPHTAYRALDVPVLLLGGERSTPAAKRVLSILRSEIPRATRVEIAGAGHMGPLTHAAEVNAAIVEHLSSA